MAILYAFMPMVIAVLYVIAILSVEVEGWRRTQRRKAGKRG